MDSPNDIAVLSLDGTRSVYYVTETYWIDEKHALAIVRGTLDTDRPRLALVSLTVEGVKVSRAPGWYPEFLDLRAAKASAVSAIEIQDSYTAPVSAENGEHHAIVTDGERHAGVAGNRRTNRR
jgi:hypothetical protein